MREIYAYIIVEASRAGGRIIISVVMARKTKNRPEGAWGIFDAQRSGHRREKRRLVA